MTTATATPTKSKRPERKPMQFRVNIGVHTQDEPRQKIDLETGEPAVDDNNEPIMEMQSVQYPSGSVIITTKDLGRKFNTPGVYPDKFTRIDNIGPPEYNPSYTVPGTVNATPPSPVERRVAGAITENTTSTAPTGPLPNETVEFMTKEELEGTLRDEEINPVGKTVEQMKEIIRNLGGTSSPKPNAGPVPQVGKRK